MVSHFSSAPTIFNASLDDSDKNIDNIDDLSTSYGMFINVLYCKDELLVFETLIDHITTIWSIFISVSTPNGALLWYEEIYPGSLVFFNTWFLEYIAPAGVTIRIGIEFIDYANQRYGPIFDYQVVEDDDPDPPDITCEDTDHWEYAPNYPFDDGDTNFYVYVGGWDWNYWRFRLEYYFGDDLTIRTKDWRYRDKQYQYYPDKNSPDFSISNNEFIQHYPHSLYYRIVAEDRDDDFPNDRAQITTSWIEATIEDDDSDFPEFILSSSTGNSNDSRIEPYLLTIKAQDLNGWKADIAYKFGINGDVLSGETSTNSHLETTISYGIPRNLWIQNLYTPIYWKYKLSDLDSDRPDDQSESDWTEWQIAGQMIDDDVDEPQFHIQNIHEAVGDEIHMLFYIDEYSRVNSTTVMYQVDEGASLEALVVPMSQWNSDLYGYAFMAFFGSGYSLDTKINYTIYATDDDRDRDDDQLSSSYSNFFLIKQYPVNPEIKSVTLSNQRLLPSMEFNITLEIENRGIESSQPGSTLYLFRGEKDEFGNVLTPASQVLTQAISAINAGEVISMNIPQYIEEVGNYFYYITVELYDSNGLSYWDYWGEERDMDVKKQQFFIETESNIVYPDTDLTIVTKFFNWADQTAISSQILIEKYYTDLDLNRVYLGNEISEIRDVNDEEIFPFTFSDTLHFEGTYEYNATLTYQTRLGPRYLYFSTLIEVSHPKVTYNVISEYGYLWGENPYPYENLHLDLIINNMADQCAIIEIGLDSIFTPTFIGPDKSVTISTDDFSFDDIGISNIDILFSYKDEFNKIRSFHLYASVEIIEVPQIQINLIDIYDTQGLEGKNFFGSKKNGFPIKNDQFQKTKIYLHFEVRNEAHIPQGFDFNMDVFNIDGSDFNYLSDSYRPTQVIDPKKTVHFGMTSDVTTFEWFNQDAEIALNIFNDVWDYFPLLLGIIGKLAGSLKAVKIADALTSTDVLTYFTDFLADLGTNAISFLSGTNHFEEYTFNCRSSVVYSLNDNLGDYTKEFNTPSPSDRISMSITENQLNLFIISHVLEIASSILLNGAGALFIAGILNPSLWWGAAALTSLGAVCDVFKYLTLLWSNSDPIDIDYEVLRERLKRDIPMNNSLGIVAHDIIDNAIDIMISTDRILLNQQEYEGNFLEENFTKCADLQAENSELSAELSDKFENFASGLSGIFSEIEQYKLISKERFDAAQEYFNMTGLTPEEIELFQDIGYTNEDIERVTEKVLSVDNYSRISKFSETFANLSYFFNVQGNLYIQSSVIALNNSVNINVDYLNETVGTATPNEQNILDSLKSQLERAVNTSDWFKAEQIALNLMNYSRSIITQTNNYSYNELYEYGNFVLQYIKLLLSLDLKLSLEEIDIGSGISEDLRISVTNKDNLPCICNISLDTEFIDWFEYNSSFELGAYETKTIIIKIHVPGMVPVGTYPVNITVSREDSPEIRDNSQLLIHIIEDDTTPPDISIEYYGLKTDENPGFWDVTISDPQSGLDEIQIYIDGSIIVSDANLNGVEGKNYTLQVPSELSLHEIHIIAKNNDTDYIGDQEYQEIIRSVIIIDDDKDPPELSNLIIIPSPFEINISFTATDYSDINHTKIMINGEYCEPVYQSTIGDSYYFTVENQWLFKKGFSEVNISVFDGDDDRPNDTLMTIISGTFKNVLYQMYEYVDWQIEELKAYIDENLGCRISRCLNWKLSKAQEHLAEAFSLVENGKITCALFRYKIAKIFIQFTESVYDKHCHLSDEHAKYILDTLHSIRNNIVILLGGSTGSERAYNIAYIEVDLLNLSDYIEQEIPSWIGKYLSWKVYCATKMLETAIFKIAKEVCIEDILRCTQWKLDNIIRKINRFLDKGRISEDLAYYLTEEITRINEDIEFLIIN